MKQRIYGALLIVCGVLTVLPDRDITAAVFLVPLGLYVMLTRECVLCETKKAPIHARNMDKRQTQRAVR